jgi:hypothetical protein
MAGAGPEGRRRCGRPYHDKRGHGPTASWLPSCQRSCYCRSKPVYTTCVRHHRPSSRTPPSSTTARQQRRPPTSAGTEAPSSQVLNASPTGAPTSPASLRHSRFWAAAVRKRLAARRGGGAVGKLGRAQLGRQAGRQAGKQAGRQAGRQGAAHSCAQPFGTGSWLGRSRACGGWGRLHGRDGCCELPPAAAERCCGWCCGGCGHMAAVASQPCRRARGHVTAHLASCQRQLRAM